jgi:hypothetical protein
VVKDRHAHIFGLICKSAALKDAALSLLRFMF